MFTIPYYDYKRGKRKIPPHVLAFYSLSYLLLREQPDESSAVPVFSPFFQVKQEFSAKYRGISGAGTSADSAGGTVIPPVQPVSRQSAEPVQSAATAPRNGRTLCAPAVNIDRYPFFSASLPPIPPRQPKGKEDDSQEGGNRRFLPSCAPAAQASTAVTCGTAFR